MGYSKAMVETVAGSILRIFNHERLCVFSEQRGKLFCINKHKNVFCVVGSSLTANISQQNKAAFYIDHIHDIFHPPITTLAELAWLHHIIELHYFFLSEHQAHQRDYQFFIEYLWVPKRVTKNREQEVCLQLLAINHFLVQTGFYEHQLLHMLAQVFQEVIDHPGAYAVPFHLIESKKQGICELILCCLQEHPQFHQFKTVPFLRQLYIS